MIELFDEERRKIFDGRFPYFFPREWESGNILIARLKGSKNFCRVELAGEFKRPCSLF
jgi:hypothetical protein